jgi:pyrroline-5-carboxylate reductase
MAGAIARGWAAGDGGPEGMLFCDIDAERARALAEDVGGETRDGLPELAADSDVVLLAVKPAALDDVARELGGPPALLSVMAATSTARLGEAFPGVPRLRVIPNQPVEVRRGVICHPPAVDMPEEMASELLALLGRLGIVIEMDEDRIEAAMAVMSCAPAYVALFAEALADAGAAEGLEPSQSLEMVAATLSGTAELLGKRDPEAIRAAVASPGGTTEAGLAALREGGFTEALGAAVEASLERFR